jgi:septal ring factor EnvC (AmiA/AmiB activator)
MIDTADLAVLETYTDAMNPVERGLVEEVRRLHGAAKDVASLEGKVLELEEELESVKSELRDSEEEVERLSRDLEAANAHELESERAKTVAEEKLAELKTELRQLLKIPSWVEEEVRA